MARLEPFQRRYKEIVADPAYLDGVLARGREAAEATADITLRDAKQAMGFLHST